MAHTKSQGKTNQKSNRPGQRRGIKKFGGQRTEVGQIIVRQVGSKVHGGIGTKTGKDFTIYAMRPGVVKFFKKLGKKFVSVVKAEAKAKKVVEKIVEKPVKKVTKKVVKKTVKKSISKK